MTGPTPGRVLVDRYELVSLIGRGPHGVVWHARERGTRASLAIKLLHVSVTARPAVLERFDRERKVLTAFLDPALVRVQELVPVDDTLALVMEFVDGEDLRHRLDRVGRLPPADAVATALVLATALGAAHAAGVVHCDVKPSNVLLAEPGGEVRLSDCRVARLSREAIDGPQPLAYADPGYAAPEVLRGGAPVPASDVYALAAILREMIGSGRVDTDLRLLIEDCLAPVADGRPTAGQLSARLRYLARQPVLTVPQLESSTDLVPIVRPPSPAPSPTPRWRRRTLTSAVVTGVVVVGGCAILVPRLTPVEPAGRPAANGSATPGRDTEPTRTANAGPSPSGRVASPLASVGEPAVVGSATTFAHDWFGALNLAVSTGDTAPLTKLSSPACQACQQALTVVAAAYAGGGALRGGTYAVRGIDADIFITAQLASLHVVFDRTPRSAVDPSGEIVGGLPGAAFLTGHMILERVGDTWRTREVQAANRLI